MKKSRTILMALMAFVIGVIFTSCNPDNGEETTKKLVKISTGSEEIILKYDDQGHLIEYADVMGLDSMLSTYTYSYVWKENAIDITIDVDGIAQETCTLDLENGLASGISENPITFDSTFKYNSSNRLIECKNFMRTQALEWNDDKLVAIHSYSFISTSNTSYTYEPNATTKGYNPLIPYTISPNNFLYVAHPELVGLATQKLFNSETFYSTMNDKEYTFSYKYEYGFDEDGYVNKIIVRHNEEDCEHIVNEYTMIWE